MTRPRPAIPGPCAPMGWLPCLPIAWAVVAVVVRWF